MELLSKIRLSWNYGRIVYLISAVLTVSMSALAVYRPVTIAFSFIIKILSIPIIHYLNVEMTKGLGIYYYLNLGISRREYYSIPFIVEFIFYIILITISGLIGYAIR